MLKMPADEEQEDQDPTREGKRNDKNVKHESYHLPLGFVPSALCSSSRCVFAKVSPILAEKLASCITLARSNEATC